MNGQQDSPGESRPNSRRDRRRIDEVFGDVLPDTTSDEREHSREQHDPDRWYRENRPPHHDR